MERLIIAVGLNENVTRDQNPNVPITPAEIAADIAECVEAGASIIHVHCRDQVTGAPIMDDPDPYVELFRTVEAETDALVYPTYPNGETVDRYKHVKALMEDPERPLLSTRARPRVRPVRVARRDGTRRPAHRVLAIPRRRVCPPGAAQVLHE